MGRLLWVSEEIIALIRELVRRAGTEQSTRLLFGSVDAISSVQALARVLRLARLQAKDHISCP